MAKESLIAARTKAIRRVKRALRPASTLALVGNLAGVVEVPGRPNCIYARLTRQLSRVIVAQIGGAPPAELSTLRNWLIEVKKIAEEGVVRYRVINWLEDALGRPVSIAVYEPARHELDPSLGPHLGSLDGYYFTESELSGPGGAGLVGIEDEGDYYDATTVEDALQEIMGPAGIVAYRHPFSSLKTIQFENPFGRRPAVHVHFNTTMGFGTQLFGSSPFGGVNYWTQEGPLATAVQSITFPSNRIKVVLAKAASGEVLCIV